MLSRRHLRIKALQALYGYYSSNSVDLAIGEKNLLRSTERIYELIIWQIGLLMELVKFAAKRSEENKTKFYPTEDDLNPNTKFINNALIHKLKENKDFKRKFSAYLIDWSQEQEMVRKIYNQVRESKDYKKYMANPDQSFNEDRSMIMNIFNNHIAYQDRVDYFYEEKNIFWANDSEIANPLVLKILKWVNENDDESKEMPTLYNTDGKEVQDEDKKFLVDLYQKTILKSHDFEEMIELKAKNWEINRIATMDVILLKMALTELTEFPSIPVKVTMNEYIELSKYYSTPKSRVFINGILDKLIAEMIEDRTIVKIGRGLIS